MLGDVNQDQSISHRQAESPVVYKPTGAEGNETYLFACSWGPPSESLIFLGFYL